MVGALSLLNIAHCQHSKSEPTKAGRFSTKMPVTISEAAMSPATAPTAYLSSIAGSSAGSHGSVEANSAGLPLDWQCSCAQYLQAASTTEHGLPCELCSQPNQVSCSQCACLLLQTVAGGLEHTETPRNSVTCQCGFFSIALKPSHLCSTLQGDRVTRPALAQIIPSQWAAACSVCHCLESTDLMLMVFRGLIVCVEA